MDITSVMQVIAEALEEVTPRVYDWPTDAPTLPCFVVGYPEIEFDSTFARGSDFAELTVYYITGSTVSRTVRDELNNTITATKEAIDAIDDNAVRSCAVTRAKITSIAVNDVTVAAVEFTVAIYS